MRPEAPDSSGGDGAGGGETYPHKVCEIWCARVLEVESFAWGTDTQPNQMIIRIARMKTKEDVGGPHIMNDVTMREVPGRSRKEKEGR